MEGNGKKEKGRGERFRPPFHTPFLNIHHALIIILLLQRDGSRLHLGAGDPADKAWRAGRSERHGWQNATALCVYRHG